MHHIPYDDFLNVHDLVREQLLEQIDGDLGQPLMGFLVCKQLRPLLYPKLEIANALDKGRDRHSAVRSCLNGYRIDRRLHKSFGPAVRQRQRLYVADSLWEEGAEIIELPNSKRIAFYKPLDVLLLRDVPFHDFWRFPVLLLLEHFLQDSETT